METIIGEMMITSEQKNQLIQAAKEALQTPYAKENKIPYAAAVFTKKGNIYAATSYFSDTFTLTLHGEQAALAHASFHGESEIVAIAVASNEEKQKGEFTNPCHLCKQLLWESHRRSKLPLLVILTNNHDETEEVPLEKMISYPWPQ